MSKANPEKLGVDLYDLLFWCGKQVREAEVHGMIVSAIVIEPCPLDQHFPEGLIYRAALRIES